MQWFPRRPADSEDIRLTVLREELWRRQDSQSRRLGTIESIAGVLVGGAALVSTIITVLPATPVLRLALVFGLATAVVALTALLPRGIKEIDPRKLKKAMRARGPLGAQNWHADHVIGQIEIREKLIGHRFRLVRAGLALLAATIACVILSIALSWEGGDNMGRDDDGWSGDVEIDTSMYETVSESGKPEVILGTAGGTRDDQQVIRLTEADGD